MRDYKVCILAAGVGSRMGDFSNYINKAVLPVNFKGVISYIIEKFPRPVEIVIAVGDKKETVMDYVTLAHPDRRIRFVEIDNYVGPGTGPGYSLLKCKAHLRCPFVFVAADTLVIEEVPPPDKNWFGIAPVKDTENYCTVKIKNNLICQLDDKIKTNNKFAFIGLAGVHDYKDFFEALEHNRDVIRGEIQVSNGFKKLIEKSLSPIGFTWFDTGSFDHYVETNKNFSGENQRFDFSKGEEFIYFVDGRVIKFFADSEIVARRCERARTSLRGLCPTIEGQRGNFYTYKKVDGVTLYNVLNARIVGEFLAWANAKLWRRAKLTGAQVSRFHESCRSFYQEKTMKRLALFTDKTGVSDGPCTINGLEVPPLARLLNDVDWTHLANGLPSHFHGDLQFDNVLVQQEDGRDKPTFVLLDWREDFGGSTEIGDLYYDLAKLYGGTILSYQLMREGMFSFDMSGSHVHYNFHTKNDLLEAREEYEEFLACKGFDLNKIKIITALIFLNMAPLHQDPFNLMLYFLGRSMLYKLMKRRSAAAAPR